MSLTERIESAANKDELEKIGKEELGVDADKRKGVETIRADLLERAESTPAQEESAPAEDDANTSVTPSEGDSTPAAQIPEASQTEDKPEPDEPKPRLLRHRGNGRLFTYSAELAAKRHIEEV
ncbi:hypothetical protein [Chromohalobacter sp. 296-RDG]|uniref:hypothetical protein n=1 Tax=Chromohalobacter sp. 296-RDG TaxID=2994062 RepID=UPI0024683BFA|nr:hypothetical protein [Chromohalobacter sp. 296-RDG]